MTHDEAVLRVARIVYEAMPAQEEMEAAIGCIQRIVGVVREREEELASNPDEWMWAPGDADCKWCHGKGFTSDGDGDKSRCVCVGNRERAETKKYRLALERLQEARKLVQDVADDFHPASLFILNKAISRWAKEEPL